MSSRDELERELARAQQALRDHEDRYAKFGTEPPVGSVIRFARIFGGKKYDYAGLRTPVGWFLTGKAVLPRERNAHTWEQVCDVVQSAYEVATWWDVVDIPMSAAKAHAMRSVGGDMAKEFDRDAGYSMIISGPPGLGKVEAFKLWSPPKVEIPHFRVSSSVDPDGTNRRWVVRDRSNDIVREFADDSEDSHGRAVQSATARNKTAAKAARKAALPS